MKVKTFFIASAFTVVGAISACANDKGLSAGLQIETHQFAEKDGEKLYLDIYLDPAVKVEGKRPVVIYSFGGGWETGTRKDEMEGNNGNYFKYLARQGYLVVGIDYRLGVAKAKRDGRLNDKEATQYLGDAAEITLDAIRLAVEDLYDATSFIVKNADRWNADPGCVITTGSSAGAINSCTAEYWRCNGEEIALKHLPEGFRYAGIIAMAGAIWKSGTEEPIWKTTPCPMLMFHGTGDFMVPYGKVLGEEKNIGMFGPEVLAAQFDEMKVPYWLYASKGADHVISGLPAEMNKGEISSFIDRFVIGKEQLAVRTEEKHPEPRTLQWWFGRYLAKQKMKTVAEESALPDSQPAVESYLYSVKGADSLFMDVYVDRSVRVEGKRPVFVYSFGGGWEGGNRKDAKDYLSFFARQGWIAVGIDYRLLVAEAKKSGMLHDKTAPDVFWRTYSEAIAAGVEDLYDATSFIVKNADAWGADAETIVISGSSAGATNSYMAEYWRCNETELAAKHLPGGFRYAGIVSAAGGVWKQGTENPVWKSKPCPMMIFHGTADQLVPYGKAVIPEANFGAFGPEFFVQQLGDMGASYYLYTAVEADHIFSGLPLSLNLNDINGFLERLVVNKEDVAITTTEHYLDEPRTIMQLLKLLAPQQLEEAGILMPQ